MANADRMLSRRQETVQHRRKWRNGYGKEENGYGKEEGEVAWKGGVSDGQLATTSWRVAQVRSVTYVSGLDR